MSFSLVSPDSFFQWLWRNSWQAATLVILITLVPAIFRNRLSPAFRSALWLLLIVRLLWPFSLQSPTSIFNVLPAAQPTAFEPLKSPSVTNIQTALTDAPTRGLSITIAKTIWVAGAASLLSIIGFNTFKISAQFGRERPLTNSSVLDLLEDCKAAMRIRTPLTVVETRRASAPLLYGFIRPRLLLPAGLTQKFSSDELRHIFFHELSHVKRADIPLNWIATALLALHWFNPFIWFAFGRMRLDRELACDAVALSFSGTHQNKSYGETIIKLVEQFSRPAWAPAIVSIVEDKNQIKKRIQMIAQSTNRKTWSILAAVLCAALGAMTFTDAQNVKESVANPGPNDAGSPRIIKTVPAVGAKDVDPATKEIIITFDRDMAGGFSWTGGPPEFPQGRAGEKPVWRDKRTCALPVSLEAGKYYRVGINSSSHQNFRSAQGIPVKPSAIYFTTRGASVDVERKTSKPEIVKMIPTNGATDVDPQTTELRVTFNMPMGPGFSWTGGAPGFPTTPEGERPYWTEDKKTCVLPVALKPGSQYRIGLNSQSAKNFQSAAGVPVEPTAYTFKTK
jgi:beta-lactamase regulating signal transducer with metallopeptidase domain